MQTITDKRAIVSEAIAFIRGYRHSHKLSFVGEEIPAFVVVEVDNGSRYSFQLDEGAMKGAMDAAAFFCQAPFALRKIKKDVGFSLSVIDKEIAPPSEDEAAAMLADLEMIGRVPEDFDEQVARAAFTPPESLGVDAPDFKLIQNAAEWIYLGADFARACVLNCYNRTRAAG